MVTRTGARESTSADKLTRPVVVVAAVICTCAVVSHMFGRSTISILLPAIRQDLVDSNTAAGVLSGTNFAGYIIGVVLVTVLAGRAEPIQLMRAGLAISAAALLLLAVAPSFIVLGVGVWLAGFGGAGIWITAPALATANVPASRRGAVLGALTATMGTALLLLSQGTTLFRKIVDVDFPLARISTTTRCAGPSSKSWPPTAGYNQPVRLCCRVGRLRFPIASLSTVSALPCHRGRNARSHDMMIR